MTTRSQRVGDRTPADEARSDREGMYVVIALGRKHYALDAGFVREVLRRRPCGLLPAAGQTVSGVMFFRGTCITVFDLCWKLTGRQVDPGRASRIIVLRKPGWAGLLVGATLGLTSGPVEPCEAASHEAGRDQPYVCGTVRWNQRRLDVVDVQRIIASETVGGRWAEGAKYGRGQQRTLPKARKGVGRHGT